MTRIPHDDRRQFIRFQITVPARYRVLSAIGSGQYVESVQVYEAPTSPGGLGGTAAWQDALTKNLGAGGLCLRADTELKVGTELEVELDMRPKAGLVLLEARVAWVHKSEALKSWLVGIDYLELRDEAREALAGYAAEYVMDEAKKNPDKGAQILKSVFGQVMKTKPAKP